jgi:hypothetical protein
MNAAADGVQVLVNARKAQQLCRLRRRLAQAVTSQALMVNVNNAHRAYTKDPDSLQRYRLTKGEAYRVMHHRPTQEAPHPFSGEQIATNMANIRKLNTRIQSLLMSC